MRAFNDPRQSNGRILRMYDIRVFRIVRSKCCLSQMLSWVLSRPITDDGARTAAEQPNNARTSSSAPTVAPLLVATLRPHGTEQDACYYIIGKPLWHAPSREGQLD